MLTATRGTLIASFKSWGGFKNIQYANEVAINRNCSTGFCIHDGKTYVGEEAELKKGGMIDIVKPEGPAYNRCA